MSIIKIFFLITVFLDHCWLLKILNSLYKVLFFLIQFKDIWILIHQFLIQIYCVRHNILYKWHWIFVDSNIEIENLNEIVIKIQWTDWYEYWYEYWFLCYRRLLLYRRSLCKSLLFCHSDDDDDDVEKGSEVNFVNDD